METDPSKPGYEFGSDLMSGRTYSELDNETDFLVNRPNGMKGFTLNITTKGSGVIICDGETFVVKENDILLIPPTVPHYYSRNPLFESWERRWVYFRPRTHWEKWLSWDKMIGDVYTSHILNQKDIDVINSCFIRIEKNIKSDLPLSTELAYAGLEKLIIVCKSLQPSICGERYDQRVLEVIDIMSRNLDKDFSIEYLAEQVGLSESRLMNLFKTQVHVSILKWRDEQRISCAKNMLVNTGDSIADISKLVGYNDPLYFSRVFKRFVGLSPNQFKKENC
ncbi:arabinose operon transcriptional regulator AraC [Psychromonas sp. SA13A]|uniref:arabinose operon transcriptional regulator AraC n=1 Tax=Psychromonas sp. SA13A TaxID=2686346 RepID=UPI00140B06EE